MAVVAKTNLLVRYVFWWADSPTGFVYTRNLNGKVSLLGFQDTLLPPTYGDSLLLNRCKIQKTDRSFFLLPSKRRRSGTYTTCK